MEKTKDFGTLLARVGKTHGVAPIAPHKRFFSDNDGQFVQSVPPTTHLDDKRCTSEQLQGTKAAFFFGEALVKEAISDEKKEAR